MRKDYEERILHGTMDFLFEGYEDFVNEEHQIFVACHWHSSLEIIFVEKGPLEFIIEGNTYTGHSGDLFFINPGELHQIYGDKKDSGYRSLVFSTKILTPEVGNLPDLKYFDPKEGSGILPSLLTNEHDNYREILHLVKSMLDIHQRRPLAWQLEILSKLYAFAVIFIQNKLFLTEKPFDNKITSINTIRTKELLEYIQNHYSEKITIETAAEIMHLTPKYFCSYFRKNFYMTFITYLNRYRINRACFLLQTTDLPIIEIALSSGFENMSYFTRKFKEIEGCKPSDFRKKNQFNLGASCIV